MIYAFERFELDTELFELRFDGKPQDLQPQVFNLLRFLVSHNDRVMSKAEIFESLWPGRVVTDAALTRCVKAARKVLRDDGENQRLIRTVHGRGYRFVGEIRVSGGAPAGGSGHDDADQGCATVAVLPFVDLSPARDQRYLTDGLTESLLSGLTRIRGIRVTGRTSSSTFTSRQTDPPSIGKALGVEHIVEGSMQKSGRRIRVTTQLVNAADGFNAWSETFDRKVEDIFVLQDEITAAVIRALRKGGLAPAESGTRRSGNFDAYKAYLRGKAENNKGTPDGWKAAMDNYRRALEIDHDMALAWAGLSEATANLTGYSTDFADGYEQARTAAHRAIELDPDLPEAFLALAHVQRAHDWDWAGAELSLRRALALRPGDPDIRAGFADLMAIRGDASGALQQLDQALLEDPLNVKLKISRIWLLMAVGRLDDALTDTERLVDANPQVGYLRGLLALVHFNRGEYDAALRSASQEQSWYRLTVEGMVANARGDSDTAMDRVAALLRECGDNNAYQIAHIHAAGGDLEEAITALERAFAIRDPGLVWICKHTALDPVRAHPRYGALLEKMGLR